MERQIQNAPAPHDGHGESLPSSMSLGYVEELYAQYLRDPKSVSADWRRYFKQIGNGARVTPQFGPSFRAASVFNPPSRAPVEPTAVRELEMALLQDRFDQLVRAYRVRG